MKGDNLLEYEFAGGKGDQEVLKIGRNEEKVNDIKDKSTHAKQTMSV